MTVPFKGDPYRLKIHLTPPTGWMNDPNGFTQYKGAYHIFYQAYPYSADGGIKHWGHVVTNDFQQYTFLPPALYPQEFYDCQGRYSGSAIEKEHELCILYTGHVADRHPKEEQCLAKSRDGVHFEKHPGNPVIPHPACMEEDFRDPYMWKKGEYYYCIIGSKWNSRGRVLLYRSRDLLSWEFVNVMLEGRENQGDMWECPCLAEYPEGTLLLISPENREGIKHSSWYFTGELDYETGRFLVEKEGRVDWGTEFYAPQMISSGGRKLLLAWMDNWESEKKSREYQWAGALTYPREVKIQRGELIMYPIEEIKKLRTPLLERRDWKLPAQTNVLDGLRCTLFDLELEIPVQELQKGKIDLALRIGDIGDGIHIFLTCREAEIEIRESGEKRQFCIHLGQTEKEWVSLRIIADMSSIELFFNEGRINATYRMYLSAANDRLSLTAGIGRTLRKIALYRLEPLRFDFS